MGGPGGKGVPWEVGWNGRGLSARSGALQVIMERGARRCGVLKSWRSAVVLSVLWLDRRTVEQRVCAGWMLALLLLLLLLLWCICWSVWGLWSRNR